MEPHINKNDYIDDFNDFKQALTKKYGEPAAEEVTWENDMFKNDKSKWGLAISMGHLQYLSHWKTSTTVIFAVLTGDNLTANCVVSYNSLRHESLIKVKEAKKSSDDL